MNAVQLPAFSGHHAEMDEPQSVSPLKIIGVIRRHWKAVALVSLLISVPTCVAIGTMQPYYDSASTLVIGTHQAPFRDLQATQSSLDIDTVAVNTEVGILKSAAVATAVAERLNLVQDPYFKSIMERVPLKTRITEWVRAKLGTPLQHKPLTADEKLQVARDILIKHVTIINDGRSYLITITARTDDATLSTAIANAFADVYLDFKRHMKISATWRANSLLDEQIVPLRDRLRKAQEAAESFREKNGLISAQMEHSGTPNAQAGVTVADQQLVETNRELIAAQVDLNAKRARAAQMRGGASNSTDVLTSPTIQQLQAQQAQLNAQAASLASTAGEANPDLRAARAAAAHIQGQIGAEIGRITASTTKDLESSEARVAALTADVQRLQDRVAMENQAGVTLKQLESEANAAQAVYQDYLGRFAQTSTEASLQEPEAELISRAERPLGVTGPARTQFMAIAVLFSLVAGAGAALVIDRMRQVIRNPAEMDGVPGLFALGTLPTFSGGLSRLYLQKTPTIYVEMVEAIRTILSFGQSRFRAKTIVVTSPGPDEGKTTVALSLAANTGRAGKRALVIDCDTRGPSVLSALGDGRSGKLPVAMDESGLVRDVLPGVDVMKLSSGKSTGDRMVTPSAIGLILADLSPHYDMIVLDTPPVLAFPDAAVLSHETDGIVLVVKWGTTTLSALKDCMRQMHTYDARVLGGILTQAPLRGPDAVATNPLGIYRHYGLLAS